MSGPEKRPKLALQVCCGPCATAVIERLANEYDVTAVWYNPNIAPAQEHDLRREAMRTVAERCGVELVELEYDPSAWEAVCAGLKDEPEGGARCVECFHMRLERVARWAAARGVGTLATTLSISPHKSAQTINAIGIEVAAGQGLRFLVADFKRGGGFQRSVALSKQWGLYRQRYCGCSPPEEPVRR